MKTQDSNYIQLQQSINKKKIEKLQSGIHILPEAEGSHIIFLEEEQVKEFDPVKHFNTVPELVERRSNRLRRNTLENEELTTLEKPEIKVRKRSDLHRN